MTELALRLTRDEAHGFVVSHAEEGPNGRVYQFRAGDAPGMLLYRWAYTNTPSTFGPWRLIGDGIFPGVREMLALAHEGKIAP